MFIIYALGIVVFAVFITFTVILLRTIFSDGHDKKNNQSKNERTQLTSMPQSRMRGKQSRMIIDGQTSPDA